MVSGYPRGARAEAAGEFPIKAFDAEWDESSSGHAALFVLDHVIMARAARRISNTGNSARRKLHGQR
jgi:hypothetical protein